MGTGRTELSSLEGTLFKITFSRCGGSAGGGSFEMEEVDANILEEEEDVTLEGESLPLVADGWVVPSAPGVVLIAVSGKMTSLPEALDWGDEFPDWA